MVKKYKSIRIDTETYEALQEKIPTGSFSEKIKKLIGGETALPRNQIALDMPNRAVPKPIIELALFETCSLPSDGLGLTRKSLLRGTARLLEELGWHKERKEFFERNGFRSSLLVTIDNALYSMARKGWIIKEKINFHDGFEFSMFSKGEETKNIYNYKTNWKIPKERIQLLNKMKKQYLISAKDIVAEEQGDKRWALSNRIPSSKSG